MSTTHIGGLPVEPSQNRLIPRYVYFVAVSGFTFQFVSLEQMQECLAWFSHKTHPSSREPGVTLEHYWQRWFERLPQWLSEEPKRKKVIKALQRALNDFTNESSQA